MAHWRYETRADEVASRTDARSRSRTTRGASSAAPTGTPTLRSSLSLPPSTFHQLSPKTHSDHFLRQHDPQDAHDPIYRRRHALAQWVQNLRRLGACDGIVPRGAHRDARRLAIPRAVEPTRLQTPHSSSRISRERRRPLDGCSPSHSYSPGHRTEVRLRQRHFHHVRLSYRTLGID
jgi:hypothetical protein